MTKNINLKIVRRPKILMHFGTLRLVIFRAPSPETDFDNYSEVYFIDAKVSRLGCARVKYINFLENP